MAIFDIFILILVVLAGVQGFRRGFLIEFFSLLSFFIGLFLALKLSFPITERFFGDSYGFMVIALISFVIFFFVVVWGARTIATSLKRLIDFTPIGIIDNILGLTLCVVKWLFIFSTTIWVLNSVDLDLPTKWIRHSDFYDVVLSFSPTVVDLVSTTIPWFKDILESMERPRDLIA